MKKSQEMLADVFGQNVFSDKIMRMRLPQNVYRALHRTIDEGAELDPAIAEVIASAMKEWAVERGATHYTHWFQPMNGQTAEKQDAFLTPHDGGVLLEFTGKALIRGEADASSFPSGGLRATFEARGYTAWDCTSPAFIREDPNGIVSLCIPTAFCSYAGEALDTRTPLLRAQEVLSRQAVRVLRCLGDTHTRRVKAKVGLEQEYFLIDRELYRRRRDLIYTGRTLFGARPPKGQEMEDQYYAAIRQRVSEFMAELNEELWKMGVAAKTQHNEVAPSQHEVAVLFDDAVAACDQNQLTMMLLRKVAARRGMAALLHEKPFAGVSGSGKHNNWSLATDEGVNLLKPGDCPEENTTFLLFFTAVIAAVDAHAGLLRLAAASASNDHRLGGHEAPTPMLSVFIGDALQQMLEHACGLSERVFRGHGEICTGVTTIPKLFADDTDRNRTSPFAFTGNKFEFRMLGSSESASTLNTVMATVVADQLARIADRLEAGDAPIAVVRDLFTAHRRVIFNGNSYSNEWREEAARRGLKEYPTTVEAIEALISEESIALFERHDVLTRTEVLSRAVVREDAYIKTLRIEARTMAKMMQELVLPAAMRWQDALALQKAHIEAVGAAAPVQSQQLAFVGEQVCALAQGIDELNRALGALDGTTISCDNARDWRDGVLPVMERLREASDALERVLPRDMWPVPTYGEMLFHI